MVYTQNHGFILLWHVPTVEILKYLKFDVGMVNDFPSSNHFYIQALYEYKGLCTDTLSSMLVCCLSAISLNVYICMKRYISGG